MLQEYFADIITRLIGCNNFAFDSQRKTSDRCTQKEKATNENSWKVGTTYGRRTSCFKN